MSFNSSFSDTLFLQFTNLVSVFYRKVKHNLSCSEIYKVLNAFCNTNSSSFCFSDLLKLDALCISQNNALSKFDLFKQYSDDYSFRYNQAVRGESILQSSLNNKNDLYYFEFLDNGSFHPEDYDKNGLLLDPARKFMNEQKNIYDEKQEYELVDLSPAQKDNLDLLLELRKRIITKAEDLYLGKQFEYMEKCLQDRELRQVEPFLNYDKAKIKSLSDGGSLLAMARDKKLFLKDLNQSYDYPKLISREELINVNKYSPILDHDNFELIDQNGKAVDKELVDNYIKNLMYFKDEQLNLELTTGNRRGRP